MFDRMRILKYNRHIGSGVNCTSRKTRGQLTLPFSIVKNKADNLYDHYTMVIKIVGFLSKFI